VTGPERPPRDHDDVRYPDPKPFRRIQLATVALLVFAAVITLTSGSRPAEVRWGTLIGLAALILVVLWATRRRRARHAAPGQNTRNSREIEGTHDGRE
jgi:hypothetical protein